MKILFVTHECSRTGAPIVLLNLIKWLITEKKINAEILFKETGDLLKDFEEITKSQYYYHNPAIHIPKVFRIILFPLGKWRIKLYRYLLLLRLRRKKFDLIYVNSASSSKILNSLKKYIDVPYIFHIHELSSGIKYSNINKEFDLALKNSDIIFPVSYQVEKLLIDSFFVPIEKVKVIYEFIDDINIQSENKKILKEDEYKYGEFIVGGSGTINLRKGTDLFIAVGLKLFKNVGIKIPISFVWVGGDPKSIEFFYFKKDIENLNLESKIFIIPAVENPFPYYNSFDMFLMTSREDPFPLVCLENAQLGKPILYFKGATGVSEFLEKSDFCEVEYLNIDQMASKILKLYEDKELYNRISKYVKSESLQFRTEILGNEIFKVIKELVK